MKPVAFAAAIVSASLLATPVIAAPEKPMKEKAADTVNEMKKRGKDLAEDVKDTAEDIVDKTEDVIDEAADGMQDTSEDIAEDVEDKAEDVADKAEDMAEEGAEKAKKAVPPGLAKKDQHPSTGKGSEQGQAARNAEEKPWWNFWD